MKRKPSTKKIVIHDRPLIKDRKSILNERIPFKLKFSEKWDELSQHSHINEAIINKNNRMLVYAGEEHTRLLDAQRYEEFLDFCQTLIDNDISHSAILSGYDALIKFVKAKNKHIKAGHYYKLPVAPTRIKENKLAIGEDFVTEGMKVSALKSVLDNEIFIQARTIEQHVFSLVMAMIMYGGINDKSMLRAYLHAVFNNENLIPFAGCELAVHVRYENDYFNEFIEEGMKKRYVNHQLIMDNMTKLILVGMRQKKFCLNEIMDLLNQISDLSDFESWMNKNLEEVSRRHGLSKTTLNFLMSYANYEWGLMAGTSIDFALMEVLKGRIKTTGLKKSDFMALLNKTYDAKDEAIDLDGMMLSESFKPIKATPNKPMEVKFDLVDAIRRIADPLMKLKAPNAYKLSKVVESLEELKLFYHKLSERILIDWSILLINNEHRVSGRKLSVKSFIGYLGRVGNDWLYYMQDVHANSMDDEIEQYIEQMMDVKQAALTKSFGYFMARFMLIYQVGVKLHNLPKINLSYTKDGISVRSSWLSPQFYYALLKQIKLSVPRDMIDVVSLLFILAYRTGMRRNELLGLELQDIEGINRAEPSIIVRNNAKRSLKTSSSIRRINLVALLSREEMEIFLRHISLLTNPRASIFHLGSLGVPMSAHTPLAILKKLTEKLGAEKIRFHDFRHTAITNLSLILCADKSLASYLTQNSIERIDFMRLEILGVHDLMMEKWLALANIIGHLTPEYSFKHYNHAALLIATQKIKQAQITLPIKTFTAISAISLKKLKENHIQTTRCENLDLNLINNLMYRYLLQQKIVKQPKYAIENVRHNSMLEKNEFNGNLQSASYSLSQIISFLKKLENLGDSVEVTPGQLHNPAYECNISFVDAECLYQNAKAVHHIKTRVNTQRFISKLNQITPTPLRLSSDKIVANQLINALQHVYASRPEKVNKFIDEISNRISKERSYTEFYPKDLNAFIEFYEIAQLILPDQWLVKLSWQIADEIKDRNISIKAQIQNKNTIVMGVVTNIEGRVKFSSALRYVAHYWLIIYGSENFLRDSPDDC